MKCTALLAFFSTIISASVATAATVFYTDGVSNTLGVTGNSWVYAPSPPYPANTPSVMFQTIIKDYGGSPLGPSGASGDSQTGFSIFGGAGYDITKLSWVIGVVGSGDSAAATTLYTGPGSVTVSPGVASEGKEDYRYDDAGGTAAKNLTFYYDDGGPVEWVSGYITRFVTTVTDISANTATGLGEVVITDFTAAGEDFFNELSALSGGSMEITYIADSFVPVVLSNPGTFSSAGSWTVVPEPSSWAMGFGVVVLVLAICRRRSK